MSTSTEDFDAFWVCYPRRIGRLAAMKAYEKARTLATAEEILAGVHRYLAHLPDEAQFICHATTFLNQGRWDDDYDTPKPTEKPRTGAFKLYVPWKDRAV